MSEGLGGPKGELFELLSEQGPLCLTAITKVSWGTERSLVDVFLFAVSEGSSVKEAADQCGISGQQGWAWLRKAGEDELLRRARNSD